MDYFEYIILPKRCYISNLYSRVALCKISKFGSNSEILETNIHVFLHMYRKGSTGGVERETLITGYQVEFSKKIRTHVSLTVYMCRRAYNSDPANSDEIEKDLPRYTDIFVFWSAGSAVYHPLRKCGPRRFLVCH